MEKIAFSWTLAREGFSRLSDPRALAPKPTMPVLTEPRGPPHSGFVAFNGAAFVEPSIKGGCLLARVQAASKTAFVSWPE